MSENPRIDELRRRVGKDPSSIAFAQLAEEYRRIGDYIQAVKICRDGLGRHPGYLSAQVTLGRALMGLKNFDEARTELEAVLKVAPDNLAAIRALAEIHQQTGEVAETVTAVPVPREAPVAKPATPAAPVQDVAAADRAENDPALEELEHWLAAIVSDRTQHR
jgi:tetratricopeptide (TPR) repeat protein